MRKIKEVLRLRYELDLDQRQIARSCSISVSTVHEYLKRAETAGVRRVSTTLRQSAKEFSEYSFLENPMRRVC